MFVRFFKSKFEALGALQVLQPIQNLTHLNNPFPSKEKFSDDAHIKGKEHGLMAFYQG